MRIFNYEIRKVRDIKDIVLDKAEENAKTGLATANLELTHHSFLLAQLENKSFEKTDGVEHEIERELRLTQEAIERDKKSINNWETQLRAINYERQN